MRSRYWLQPLAFMPAGVKSELIWQRVLMDHALGALAEEDAPSQARLSVREAISLLSECCNAPL